MRETELSSPYRGMKLVASLDNCPDQFLIQKVLQADADFREVRFCSQKEFCTEVSSVLPDLVVTADDPEQILSDPELQGWRPVLVRVTDEEYDEEAAPEATIVCRGRREFEECLAAAKVAVLESKLQELATLSSTYLRTGPYRRFASSLVAFSDRNLRMEIPVGEIFAVTAAGNYLSIDSSRGQFRMRDTLENLENRLDPEIFTRVHRSILVNRAHVRGLVEEERSQLVHLANGEVVAVGPKYRRNVELLRGA